MRRLVLICMAAFLVTSMSFASLTDSLDYSVLESDYDASIDGISFEDIDEISIDEIEWTSSFSEGAVLNPEKELEVEAISMMENSADNLDASEKSESRSENQKPIAQLKYAIMNPDSLVDGQITTNTQIAWLWSYNGQNFLVDPDGDQITNMNIDGIPKNSIVGYLTGNIGFATKFDVAGQYILRFKCMDEHGLWSDVWSINVPVEPADGNKRPNCVINYSTLTGDTNTQFIWGWFNSSDPDGDSIDGIEGTVVKDGEYVSINNYIVNQDANGCATRFSQAGTYTVMFRVKDSKNAWSDWVSLNAEVNSAVPAEVSDVIIKSVSDDDYKYYYSDMTVDEDDYAPRRGIWINEKVGCEALEKGSIENYYPDFMSGPMSFRLLDYPATELAKIFAVKVEHRKIINDGFTISGTLNKPNTTIAVAYDLFGQLQSETIQTDVNGDFTATFAADRIPESENTTYAWYGNLTTSYIEPSTIKIIMPGNQIEEIPVYFVTGAYLGHTNIHNSDANISGHRVLKRFYKIGQPGYWEFY